MAGNGPGLIPRVLGQQRVVVDFALRDGQNQRRAVGRDGSRAGGSVVLYLLQNIV